MNSVITILGCGDSAGVPRIGGEWGACDPNEPKNARTRPSLLVQTETSTVVVDTGPDFREQLTREKILDLNGVLYTHGHSDHVNGMDELRSFHRRQKKHLPIFLDAPTKEELYARFDYIFEQKSSYYPAVAEPHVMEDSDFGFPHHLGDIEFTPFLQDHGDGARSLGYRFGQVGYSTDMVDLDKKAIETLKGIKIWIADCADYHRPNGFFHANIDRLQKLNKQICAEYVVLVHMGISMDYEEVRNSCPDGYLPAFDGMKIKSDGTFL
ncbi:MAG: MBL fold metallo-hydrolase [Alphaproteobacteria bacterium]|nr:MBL fold metallo-hydrolase [Alphaproteobacteria bacterium]MCB9984731.1 MBL fold metallo-hydrolase [Micavibrio sp.]HPQ50737.1 MBL fold metallo-hydrolase [Alphaproteobacteria bacterium]